MSVNSFTTSKLGLPSGRLFLVLHLNIALFEYVRFLRIDSRRAFLVCRSNIALKTFVGRNA